MSSAVILLHHHSTEFAINEIRLYETLSAPHDLDTYRIETLYGCLNAIRSWFDIFFTIPPADYVNFTFSVFSQLFRCLMALYKLSTIDNPTWDTNLVRKTADLLPILDQLVLNLRRVDRDAGLDEDSAEGSAFCRTADKYDSMRAKCKERFAVIQTGVGVDMGVDPMGRINDEAMPGMTLDLSGMSWLSDIFVAP